MTRLHDSTGRSAGDVVRAYTVVRDGFGLAGIYRDIDALDNKIDGQVQLDLYQTAGRLVSTATSWFLKNDHGDGPLGVRIADLREARKILEPKIGGLLPAFMKERLEERRQGFAKAGAPEKLAEQLAALSVAELFPDIARSRQRPAPTWSRQPGPFSPSARRSGSRASRMRHAPSRPPTTMTDLAFSRAIDMIGAARGGIAVSPLLPASGAWPIQSACGSAGGERTFRPASGCRRSPRAATSRWPRLSVAAG